MLRGHRDLKVYQSSYKLAMVIFHLSKAFPREEIYIPDFHDGSVKYVITLIEAKPFSDPSGIAPAVENRVDEDRVFRTL